MTKIDRSVAAIVIQDVSNTTEDRARERKSLGNNDGFPIQIKKSIHCRCHNVGVVNSIKQLERVMRSHPDVPRYLPVQKDRSLLDLVDKRCKYT
jgi:hypothetical protein